MVGSGKLVDSIPAGLEEDGAVVTSDLIEEAPTEKLPEEEAPPKEADVCLAFEVRLVRPRADVALGLTADYAGDKVVHVCRLSEEGVSCVRKWNESAPDSQKIRVGDYITEVNGLSSATLAEDFENAQGDALFSRAVTQAEDTQVLDALRTQMKTATAMVIKVVRPVVWESTVQKPSGGLGFKLSFSENGIGLVITDVGGAAASAVPALQAGDRIVGADGTEGSPDELLKAIKVAEGSVVLKMSRPAL